MSLAVDVIVIGVPGPQGVGTFAALTDVNFGSFIDKDFAQWDAGTAKLIGTPLSATAPLTFSPTTGVFTIPAASGAQNGYLASADWTTFNNKVNKSGDALTGPLTFSTARVGQLSGNFYGVGESGQNQGFRVDIGTSFQPSILTRQADGASAVACFVDTSTAWSNAGAKLWSWRTNGVEVASVAASGLFSVIRTNSGAETACIQINNASDAMNTACALNFSPHVSGLALAKIVAFRSAQAFAPTALDFYTYDDAATPAGLNRRVRVDSAGVTLTDAVNFILGTSTGTKWGTAASQKQAWFGAAPVVQGLAVADAAGGATVDTEARTALNTLLSRMRTYGLIAT